MGRLVIGEYLHWRVREELFCWLIVGAGVWLASSTSESSGCEAELAVLPISHLVDNCSGELVVICPEVGFYSAAGDFGSPPVLHSAGTLVPGLTSALARE